MEPVYDRAAEEMLARERMRGRMLRVAGASRLARWWAAQRCRRFGVDVSKVSGAVELRRGDRAVWVAPKHIFFARQIGERFEVFGHALPAVERGGVAVVDYAAHPNDFNVVRRCLELGVTVESREGRVWLHKDVQVMVLRPAHFVYAVNMAEQFELYFAPLVPEERDGLQVLDYSEPARLQTYRASGLQFEMASFPEEEEAIEEYFRWYRPKRGDLVFDLGAHCGVSTYALSKLVGPEGRVVAFEPDPGNYAILRRNMERHGLTNVTAVPMALAGTAGSLEFSAEGTIGSSLLPLLGRDSVGSVIRVEALTLGDAFARWGVPAFCKVDIEGAETEVLAKSGEVLRARPTQFALDTHHFKPDGQTTTREVEATLRRAGYEVASEAKPLWTTWARPQGVKA